MVSKLTGFHSRVSAAVVLIGSLLLTASGLVGCESEEFSEAARAEAPDESMLEGKPTQRRDRTEGSLPSGHPPVAKSQGGQNRAAGKRPKKRPSGGAGRGGGSSLPVEWSAPENWTQVDPSSRMRAAEYRLSGDGGPATLAVYHFGAKGGGSIRANIDRWVGQFENPGGGSAEESADVEERSVDGVEVQIVDVSGTYNPGAGMGAGKAKKNQRMLGAIAKTAGGLVFFKLIGPESTVGAHAEEFDSFIGSLKAAE